MADIEKQILIDVNIDNKDAQKQLEQINIALQKNKEQVRDLKKAYDAGEVSIEDYAKETTQLKLEQQKLTESQRVLTREVQAESNSINALRAQLASLTKERNETNTSTAEGAARFNELQGEILKTSDKLKELEQAGGDFRRNVGNYPQSVNPIKAAFSSLGESAKQLFTTLLANPFVAVAAAGAALFQAFKRNDEAATFFLGVSRALGAILDKVVGLFVDGAKAVGGFFQENTALFDLIKDVGIRIINQLLAPLNLLIDTFKAGKLVIEGEFSAAFDLMGESAMQNGKALLGMQNETYGLSAALVDVTNDILETVDASIAYEKALDDLEEKTSAFAVTEQELINQRDRLRIQAKDITKSEEERIKLLEKADKIDEELLNKRIALIDEEIAAHKSQMAVVEEGGQEYEDILFKVNDLEVQRLQAINERLVFEEKAINQRNKLYEKEQEEIAKRQKAEEELFKSFADQFQVAQDKIQETVQRNAEASFQRTEATLQFEIESEKKKLSTLELSAQERKDLLNSIMQQELELLNMREQHELENTDLTAQEKLLIEENYQRERQKLAENTQQEIDKIDQKSVATKQQVEAAKGQAVAGFFSLANSLAQGNKEAEKAIGITQAIINTGIGVTKALATLPPPVSFITAATTLAQGTAQVVRISKAAGGGSFRTKGPTMLMVGDNPGGVEHVQVTPISGKGRTEIHSPNLIAMAGGGSLTAGSGVVSDSITADFAQVNASKAAISNAVKSLPAPVVSVKEITRKADRVSVKETQNL